jgi:hypothetical protein
MTIQGDASIGLATETTYGTIVTPNHWVEFVSETIDWNPTFTPAVGMRIGRVVQAADRRVLTKEESGGDIETSLWYKSLGILFNSALGTATSTLISGSGYQQLFTPTTSDYLPSYTIQKGIPPLGGGSLTPQTYAGMVCSGFEITAGNAGIPTVKFTYGGKSMDTSTGLTAASYVATNQPWSFVQGQIVAGGTLTVPTTTALATMASPTLTADIRDFSFTWSNELDTNGFNFGSSGQRTRKPALGERKGTGSITVEYDGTLWRDAFRNQTDLSLLLTYTGTTAISSGVFPTFQLAIPDIRLNGEMPKPNAGDVITQTIPFDVLDNRSAASPVYVAIVTPETAI